MSFLLSFWAVSKSMQADLIAAVGIGLSAMGSPQAQVAGGAALADLGQAPISVEFLLPGSGVLAGAGDRVTFHYIVRTQDGREIANSVKRGMPFTVELDGMGSFWSTALDGLREGGRSLLKANSSVFFGKRGVPPIIPADTPFEAEVSVVKVQKQLLTKKS